MCRRRRSSWTTAGSERTTRCYRAKAVFGLDSALLVTQGFHLPRALFVCNALGLKADGVEAANRRYWPVMSLIWNVREQFATVAALVDVYVSRPQPILGEPQPIFSTSAGQTRRLERAGATDRAEGVAMTREEALALVREYVKNEGLVRHMLCVEACMRLYAEKFGEDVETWGQLGLIHDFDWEIHPTLEEHPSKGAAILRERGVAEDIIQDILSHGIGTGVPRDTRAAQGAVCLRRDHRAGDGRGAGATVAIAATTWSRRR